MNEMTAFDIVSVLEWTGRECDRKKASERVRMECFSLVGSIKSKGGKESEACSAVHRLLEMRYPPQMEIGDE